MIHPQPRRAFLQILTLAAAIAAALPLWAAAKFKPAANSALIVVDVQNGFVTGGTLLVAKGQEVVPVINKTAAAFSNSVVTQDRHTAGHASFASAHAGKKPFKTTLLACGQRVLWPVPCMQGTDAAALHRDLTLPTAQRTIRNGFRKDMDSGSAFEEADHKSVTGLAGDLKARGIETVVVGGLATDFCVGWTAMDGRKAGFEVDGVENASRPIDLNGSLAAAWKQMTAKGAKRIQRADIELG